MTEKKKTVDFLATEWHFYSHLKPLYDQIPKDYQGKFFISEKLEALLKDKKLARTNHQLYTKRTTTNLTVCASFGDLKKARKNGSRVILTEHGAGQSYVGDKFGSYIGSPDRRGVLAITVPGEAQAERQLEAYPTIPVYQVGLPKFDKYHANLEQLNQKNKKDTVVVSFHWDCHVCPETRSAFRFYKRAVSELTEHYNVIGHGHPRDFERVYKPFWERLGVEAVQDFNECIDKGWLYICDNSSTIFEWASLDRPVLLLNAPIYRRDVNHGLRFWDYSNIGINVNHSKNLIEETGKALADKDNGIKKARREGIQKIYGASDGKATERSVQAIVETLEKWY